MQILSNLVKSRANAILKQINSTDEPIPVDVVQDSESDVLSVVGLVLVARGIIFPLCPLTVTVSIGWSKEGAWLEFGVMRVMDHLANFVVVVDIRTRVGG